MTQPIVPEPLAEEKPSLGFYSLDPAEATLTPNTARCLECDRDMSHSGGPLPTCPAEPEHIVESLHTTGEALGYDNDDDFFNWDKQQFEYPST